jgi:hypothetical protein
LTSGKPATDVKMDNTPANTDADATITQSTPPNTLAVPIVATAVCATVLIARIPAHFNHFFVLSLMLSSSLSFFAYKKGSHYDRLSYHFLH